MILLLPFHVLVAVSSLLLRVDQLCWANVANIQLLGRKTFLLDCILVIHDFWISPSVLTNKVHYC